MTHGLSHAGVVMLASMKQNLISQSLHLTFSNILQIITSTFEMKGQKYTLAVKYSTHFLLSASQLPKGLPWYQKGVLLSSKRLTGLSLIFQQ